MEKGRNKKILLGAVIFFGAMLLCTLFSKGIYASGLPQVTVKKPGKMVISHEVEASGNVKPGKELAYSVRAGLRVKEVLISVGDSMEEGQVLFILDTEALKEEIAKKELEADKLELQLATLQHNQNLLDEEKNREMQRAGEDAIFALAEAQSALQRAKEDEEDANHQLRSFEADAPESDDEEVWKAWAKERKALQDAVTDAVRAREDAEAALQETQLSSARNLEDNLQQEQTDSGLGIAGMEFARAKEEVRTLSAILQGGGEMKADWSGIVTRVNVMPGGYTTEEAAVVFADGSVPFLFDVILDQEQKKYVDLGAEAQVVLGNAQSGRGKAIFVEVDYLTEIDNMPGSWRAQMKLPEGKGSLGQGGTFLLTVQSESFDICIPLDALYTDGNGRNFVFCMEETDTVLGAELAARKMMVEVLDKNDKYAALSPGTVNGESQVIIAATKEFADGEVVRLKE